MIKHYLKIAFRFMKKNKLVSFINISGLSIAFAFCVLIFFYVKHEYSYDRFHTKNDRLYILKETWYSKKERPPHVYMPVALAPVLEKEAPAIKHAVRFSDDGAVVKKEEKAFPETVHFTDPAFFEIFSFKVSGGSPSTLLAGLNNVVISADIAKKYYGNENPVGKQLTIDIMDVQENYIVTGVVTPPPTNSSLQFSILLRTEKRPFYERNNTNWNAHNTPTFIEVAENTNLTTLQKNLDVVAEKYIMAASNSLEKNKNNPEDAPVIKVSTIPLTGLHLNTEVNWINAGDPKYTWILSGIALLILVIACINFVSLSITSASGRITEVGVRKVIGAYRSQLIRQYWTEALLMGGCALVLSILFVQLFMPVFNELTGKQLSLNAQQLLQATGFLTVITLLISIITGGYPSWFLSSFKPAQALKGRNTYRFKPGLIKGMVVVQYALSAFLIISAIVMYRQMNFVTKKDLGYNQQQLVIIPTHTGYNTEGTDVLERFRNALQNDPDVISVTGTNSPPGNDNWSLNGFTVNGEQKSAFIYNADYDFIKTMDMELVQGRDFSRSFSTDTGTAIIVNEALVKDMGWKEPIGQQIPWNNAGENKNSTVIGVVKDYNYLSLESTIMPLILQMQDQNGIQYIVARIKPTNIPETIGKFGYIWRQVNAGKPFDYSFQDENVAAQYNQYRRWSKIMGIATIMAVLIACLGLFGLAGIIAVNKTKEIGIRKVFGAGVQSLLLLLNRDIAKLSVLSFIIALPAAWYFMNQWLQNFAYRISITWDIITLSLLTAFLIALITVSYHSLKAALRNPVKSLRSE